MLEGQPDGVISDSDVSVTEMSPGAVGGRGRGRVFASPQKTIKGHCEGCPVQEPVADREV